MLTYTSFSAYHRKEKKFYDVQVIDFLNNVVKVCEKEKIGIGGDKMKVVSHVVDFKLEDVILFVTLDVIKGSKKKQQTQMMTLQMFNKTKYSKKRWRKNNG
jgi:hypothetical protein